MRVILSKATPEKHGNCNVYLMDNNIKFMSGSEKHPWINLLNVHSKDENSIKIAKIYKRHR